jgi:murein DD-endopeptidase MepM/ murein hydrolase activator NlpD
MAFIALAVLSLGAVTWFRPRVESVDPAQAPLLDAMFAAPVERVETHVLSRGETLSDVLSRASITGTELAEFLLSVRRHLNPRRLTEGAEITVRRWTHNDATRAVEVRMNADSTIRLVREELGWTGRVLETPVVVDTVYVAGQIDRGRTLYEALVYDENSPLIPSERVQLVHRLAEVYEFKLDFTREIQPGDTYRLVYERERRPDGTARNRRILVSELVNQSVAYAAIWYEASAEVRGYYDAQGKPLKTGFSRYPVAFPRITSRFNPNRYHPILKTTRAHAGTDFGASSGTPVRATADGTVTFAGNSGGYGRLVKIQHVSGYETRYAHLSRFGGGVRTGVRVRQGQEIGYVGASGLATAPHLHYELRKNGSAVDAMRARLPDAPPLQTAHLEQYLIVAQSRQTLLGEATQRYLASRSATASRLAED